MPDKYIVEHCSPTLAGLKTANLFSVHADKGGDIYAELRTLNGRVRKKGLRVVPVKVSDRKALIYMYRPDRLKRDLGAPEAVRILKEKGYDCRSAEHCIVQLVENLKNSDVFPHEIGLFLGYPPCDVRGFMNSPTEGVKCSGCWKAYGNREKAEQTFKRFKKCTEIYCREISCGRPLEKLIVSSPRR